MSAINDKNILLNNGTTIHVATFQTGEPVAGATSVAKGTNHPPTVIDMSGDIILLTKPVVPDYYKNNLVNAVSYEVWSSDSYQNDKTYFNNNVRWLWGSVDAGGCYIRKTAAGKACVGGVTCLARNEASETYRYMILESASYSIHDMSDLVFMYDENTLGYDYPIMYVLTLADMRVYGTSPQGFTLTYYDKHVYNAFTHLYADTNCFSIDEMTQYITWEGISGDKPSCYVKGEDGMVFPHNLEYAVLGLFPAFNDTIVSGDPWGGQLADDEDDPTNEGGSSQEGGGGGSYPSDTSNQDHPDAGSMSIDVCNSGFITLYNPTLSQVKSFNDWLFTDITDAISTQLKRLWANPLDFTVFLALCHFNPPHQVDSTIQYAGIDTGVIAHKISKQFVTLDMGICKNTEIDDLFHGDTNTFLDYDPYTKLSIYLPYIGVQPIKADEAIGSKISLVYNVDMLTGSCIATLKFTRSVRRDKGDADLNDVVYHYSGNCYETIPLTATDWRGLYQAAFQIIGGLASVGAGIAGGNAGAIGGGLVQAVDGVIGQKVTTSRSGQLSGSTAYMDSQEPYIIVERPIDDNPYNYRAFKGYVLNMRYNLGNLKGYTEIESETLWVDKFDGITEEEAEMLRDITGSGFYL